MAISHKECAKTICYWTLVVCCIGAGIMISVCTAEHSQKTSILINGGSAEETVTFENEFREFMVRFNKHYENLEEYQDRYKNFAEHFLRIQHHNAEASKGIHKFTLEIGEFGDWTESEMEILTGSNEDESFEDIPLLEIGDFDVPSEKNWTDEGCVTRVKNQGSCNSCWAFGAIAAIESANCLKTNKLVELSEQQLIDCNYVSPGYTCSVGAYKYKAYDYLIEKGGAVDTEKSYKYVSGNGTTYDTCRYDKSNVGGYIKKYKPVRSGDEEELKRAVAKHGPIVVSIDQNGPAFRDISYGVIDVSNDPNVCKNISKKTGKYKPNYTSHAVLVTGYGTTVDTKEDYWIVKNSWGLGKGWYGTGYWLMSRNKDNQCNIASKALVVFA